MAKSNRPKDLPKEIRLPSGEIYVLVVMKVQSRREEDNRPEDLTYIPDEQTIELVGGEEFITAYVRKDIA